MEFIMIKNIEKEVIKITKWIKKYVESAKADGVVIGNSGGKDSATVIALACTALGKDKILTVAMPCNSNQSDYEDAKLVADKFEVPLIEVNLTKIYEEFEKELKGKVVVKEEWREKESKINTKPRLRMTVLYYLAQNLNYLVIGTGNKCESIVGYTTKWGDNACDLNPIGDFTVEEVLQIGKYLGVPDKIINKAPSDGLGILTDEEKLGVTYNQITEYIETGKTEAKAMEIIQKKKKMSEHKRKPIPVYRRKEA